MATATIAISAFEQSIALSENKKKIYTPVYFFLGQAYQFGGNKEEAQKNYDKFKALSITNGEDNETKDIAANKLPTALTELAALPNNPNPLVCPNL